LKGTANTKVIAEFSDAEAPPGQVVEIRRERFDSEFRDNQLVLPLPGNYVIPKKRKIEDS
jgi:hypothetical protein